LTTVAASGVERASRLQLADLGGQVAVGRSGRHDLGMLAHHLVPAAFPEVTVEGLFHGCDAATDGPVRATVVAGTANPRRAQVFRGRVSRCRRSERAFQRPRFWARTVMVPGAISVKPASRTAMTPWS